MAKGHVAKTVWKGKMAFESEIDTHTIQMDAKPPLGEDTAPGPKILLLSALTGCSGVDVVLFLKKLRVPFTELEIIATAPLTEGEPQVYTHINLEFRVTGKALSLTKVEKAVSMSVDQYCGVALMLKAHCPIYSKVVLVEG